MNWRLFIALRYFRVRRQERFVSTISLISIMGVSVGVACLIIVLAVMSGFDNELKSRIVGTNAHLYIEKEYGPLTYPDENISYALMKDGRIKGYSPFVSGQGIIRAGDLFSGALITGIDEVSEKTVIDIKKYILEEERPILGEDGLMIGSELARELNLQILDRVSVVSANSKRPKDFVITAIFKTGLYTFDAQNVFIALKPAQELFAIGDRIGGVAARVDDGADANLIKRDIAVALGYPYFVKSWMDMNQNLFSALRLEKITMFVILTLIVLVACFNIASTLIVKVVEKTKDIGILKAIGATNRDIQSIFRLEGLFIGA
ncbi:MAG: ABC transporter permease, partial [Candidatus Omnitrophica bacterium]|nr:ABC transporter permease [Candidatus Omnitrophota bacterium]